jgi:MoxR-like ATPase
MTDPGELLDAVLTEVSRVVVGQDTMLERMVVALLARGHCLLEGVPGVAKSLAVDTLARAIGGTSVRIQFTPDLVPSDIIGTRVYRPSKEDFEVELGPVFANLVLADEVNRAPAKVQSALLEVMAERQVSLAGTTYPLPSPFVVFATQNPLESEGVYPLPEAQLDRFLLKVDVPTPSMEEELEIVSRMSVDPPRAEEVISLEQLVVLQRAAESVFVHEAVSEYAVRIVMATRQPEEWQVPELAPLVVHGASPRGSLGLVAAARALALVHGRDYALPEDVAAVAVDVLSHRLVLTYDAIADGVPRRRLIERVLEKVAPPAEAQSAYDATA